VIEKLNVQNALKYSATLPPTQKTRGRARRKILSKFMKLLIEAPGNWTPFLGLQISTLFFGLHFLSGPPGFKLIQLSFSFYWLKSCSISFLTSHFAAPTI